MSVTSRLVFDPTEAASSHNVGAYVRAGTDGDLIGSETLNSLEWLRVSGPIIDSAGNEVGVTSNALDVNVASGTISVLESDVYAEDSAHTTGDDGGFILAIRNDTRASLVDTNGDYSGLQLTANGDLRVRDDDANALLTTIDADTGSILSEIQGLSHLEDAAHSSGDAGIMGLAVRNDTLASLVDTDGDYAPLQVNADGALYVAIASIDDAALANTAIQNTATAVSTTAVNVSSPLSNRKYLFMANEGNKSLYWGQTGVTTSNGFPLHPGMQVEARAGASLGVQIIGESGASSEDLRVLELS